MNHPTDSSPRKATKPPESQSQDAERLAAEKPRPEWETRQPAQVTKADVEKAEKHPEQVAPPGEMGESQGAAS